MTDGIVEIKLGDKVPLTSDDTRVTHIGCNLIALGVVSKLADESLQVPDQDNFGRSWRDRHSITSDDDWLRKTTLDSAN